MYLQNFIQIIPEKFKTILPKTLIPTPLTLRPDDLLRRSPSACLIRSVSTLTPQSFHASVRLLRIGQAIDLLVAVSSMCCHTSTPALSTLSSSRGLTSQRKGYPILRGASRLDAFSVYPFRTWLLCRAPGRTADAPVVRPSRSSRTEDSSSQISCARAG